MVSAQARNGPLRVLEGDAAGADVDEFDRGVAKAPGATLEAPDDA